MIQPVFSGMIRLLLAKFILNDVPHALYGNPRIETRSTPFIGVWYETPEVRTKVESTPSLLESIGSTIQNLTRKYGTGPRYFGFARMEADTLATHTFGGIIMHVVVADMWVVDKGLTKQALRYVLAHEFGHYMMVSGHVKIPLPKGPKWREARREWKEGYADEFAERESGMSREEANMVTAAIGRKMLGESG